MLVYDKEDPVTDNLITWVFDENSFVPAAKLVGDKSYSILTDHLGTPYEAYDENGEKGNVSDVLLEFQYHYNQQNTKKTKVDFSFIHHREKSFSSL